MFCELNLCALYMWGEGNRTEDELQGCSELQPTLPPRAPGQHEPCCGSLTTQKDSPVTTSRSNFLVLFVKHHQSAPFSRTILPCPPSPGICGPSGLAQTCSCSHWREVYPSTGSALVVTPGLQQRSVPQAVPDVALRAQGSPSG